jgi:hypothetical protein
MFTIEKTTNLPHVTNIISYVWQIGGLLYGKDYQLRVADWWFSLW